MKSTNAVPLSPVTCHSSNGLIVPQIPTHAHATQDESNQHTRVGRGKKRESQRGYESTNSSESTISES